MTSPYLLSNTVFQYSSVSLIMEAPLSLLSSLYNWLTGTMTEPTIRQTNLRVLKIPADGSTPHTIQLNTIDVVSEGNVDSCNGHIPDFRPHWGTQEGFHWRDIYQMTVEDQSLQELNGIYFGWKSFAMDLMPISEQTGFCGDAFVAKTPTWEFDENGTVYEDFPVAFIGSPLLHIMLERMHDR